MKSKSYSPKDKKTTFRMEISSDFKKFIRCVLGRARLKEETINCFTDEESMKLYAQAFVHKSFDPNFNYEKLELRGDVAVNLSAMQYLRENFPRVVTPVYLTKLKHKIISEEWLPKLARILKFDWWVRYSSKKTFAPNQWLYLKKDFVTPDKTYPMGTSVFFLGGERVKVGVEKPEYISVPYDLLLDFDICKVLEDVFEAFFGALLENFDRKMLKGVGFGVAYKIIKSVYEETPIPLRWDKVNDSKSRLKELYDAQKWTLLSRDFSIRNYSIRGDERLEQDISIVIYVPFEGKKIRIASAKARTEKKAWEKASRRALYELRVKYNIREKYPSPYLEVGEGEALELPAIPEDFARWLRHFLTNVVQLEETFVFRLTKNEYLLDWYSSFIEKTYNKYFNLENLSKFIGIGTIDACVIDYIYSNFPFKKEGEFTTIKHNFMSKDKQIIPNYALQHGFAKYILLGDEFCERLDVEIQSEILTESRSYMELVGKVFKTFVGTLFSLIVKETKLEGVAYGVCCLFLADILDSAKLTQKKDAKTQLRELYNKLRWDLNANTEVIQDEETKIYTAEIYGFPKGNRKAIPRNRAKLGVGQNTKKSEAVQMAAAQAISTLKKYRIK